MGMLVLAAAAWTLPALASGKPCPPPSAPTSAEERGYLGRALVRWGDWVDAPPHGRAWRPGQVDPEWRPYLHGCWSSGEGGWSWVTDEPWGGLTYHYGRWTFHGSWGWVWVPGRAWGTAWVAWRRDREVVGWAPLPPAGAPSMAFWTFVPAARFQGEWADSVALPRPRIPALLMRTRERGAVSQR